MSYKQVLIYGCGGHSRAITDVLISCYEDITITYIDESAKDGETLFGFPVFRKVQKSETPIFFAIGDNQKRKDKYEQIGSDRLISICSPKAHIALGSELGKGVFIGNFAHVGPQAKIGNNTILSSGSNVEHESVIGNHSHVGSRAVVSGRCKVGDIVIIGVNAVIKDYVSICSNVIIGAGAVVVKNITEPGVYRGCPATLIKPKQLNNL